jgi:hypothetical protein
MATARELLEQADELMRRNRRVESDIPVLTDSIVGVASVHRMPQADIPVLTQKVEPAEVKVTPAPGPSFASGTVFEGDPSDWLVMDTIDPSLHSITGGAPDTLAVVPPVTLKAPEPVPDEVEGPARVTLKAAGSAATPPPAGSNTGRYAVSQLMGSRPAEPMPPLPRSFAPAVVPPVPPDTQESSDSPAPIVAPEPVAAPSLAASSHVDPEPSRASDDERWRSLAEQVSMQVLQRLDLFTDTGLRDQLTHHLQPIVDRASAELVASINEQVGKLVRSYVAEAIEREIAQWRQDHH